MRRGRARSLGSAEFGVRSSKLHSAIRIPHSACLLGLVLWFGASAWAGEVRLTSVKHARPVIPLFERCELTIGFEGTVSNPYDPDEVTVDAVFQPERGEPVVVAAFYYQPFTPVVKGGQESLEPAGPAVWKARFTPRQTGKWSYEIRLKTPQNTQTLPGGTIEVVRSTRRGFVGLDRSSGYFRFDEGQTFIPIGENLAWASGSQPLRVYDQWFLDLAKQRANFIRVWMAPWAFRLETKETGVGHYDQRRAWQLDYLLERSDALGLYWQLSLLDHGSFSRSQDPEWHNNPYNEQLGGMCPTPNDFVTDPKAKAAFQKLLRYIVARWSYSPQLVTWELFNEADLSEITMDDFTSWVAQMSVWLHAADPNRRPVTVSFHHESAEAVWRLPSIDIIQQHVYDQRDFSELFSGSFIPRLQQTFHKPVMIGEFGWIGEFMRAVDSHGIHLHDGLWASLMGGSPGGALVWYWDQYVHPNHLERHFLPAAMFWRQERITQPLSRLRLTFSNTDLGGCGIGTSQRAYLWLKNRTHTVDAWLAYRCELAKQRLRQARGQAARQMTYPSRVIHGATVTVSDLDQLGRYRVEWWDTYRGRVITSAIVPVQWGALTLLVPDLPFDIAVKLVKLHWWEHS